MSVLLPLLAVLIWALNTIVSKAAAGVLDPAAISIYRWVVAAIVLTPFCARPLWRKRAAVRPWLGRYAVLSAMGMVLYQCIAYYAAHSTSATNIGVICALIPLLVLVINGVVFRQRVTGMAMIGVAISLVGVVWLLSKGHPASLLASGIGRGDMLMLVAATAYALYGVLYRRWAPPFGLWINLYVQVLIAVVMLIPLAFTAHSLAVPAAGVGLVLFAGIASSIVASYFWMHGIERIGSERTAVLMNLLPLFTALFASVLLGETIQSHHWIGGGLILLGVSLTQGTVKMLFGRRALAGVR
ncbi:DMT family transporter [Pararobbsia silviterrae]|uniref:DMT family transporter n=1 Tax=Pararobbsia silviterrae TaxID=1792498 RepID=A0A494XAD5_9BURK|nr:DMT family transporter [Pararobbsia silviterrae]RKP47715.1 DMT family transporter [Pararobbsia silviterrae]